MISEADIQNLQSLRAAAHRAALRVAAAKVSATGEHVAVVSAQHTEAGKRSLVPLGCFFADSVPMVDDQGRLTEAALQRFESLLRKLLFGSSQAWFYERDQRVQVAFLPMEVSGAGVRGQDCGDAITLLRGDPHELFEALTEETT